MTQTETPPTDPSRYTIDDLAAKTGVPSRTIRFYQAKGVLPPPRRDGRVAYYDDGHIDRLAVVGQLQDKGLNLRAIRDLCSRRDLDSDGLQKWLGVGERLGELAADTPQLLTEEELKRHLGDPPPGVIGRLVRHGQIAVEGEGSARRYLVRSPALLELGRKLLESGVQLETALALHEILQKRFERTAEEVVDFAAKNVGKGFGRTANPEDVMSVIDALFAGGVGGEAVKLIFKREVERAVQRVLHLGRETPKRS